MKKFIILLALLHLIAVNCNSQTLTVNVTNVTSDVFMAVFRLSNNAGANSSCIANCSCPNTWTTGTYTIAAGPNVTTNCVINVGLSDKVVEWVISNVCTPPEKIAHVGSFPSNCFDTVADCDVSGGTYTVVLTNSAETAGAIQ